MRRALETARRHLTYANVVATLALFLVVAGGTVYAARVAKKSVGPSQLKANAVTTAKLKANAVTTRKIRRNAVSNAKIKDGAVESQKIANGSVQGFDIDLASTPFGRVVHEAQGSSIVAVTETSQLYPLSGTGYTQPVGEIDAFVGALDVRFAATCDFPRTVAATVAIDAANPLDPQPYEAVAAGVVTEPGGVPATNRRVELSPVAYRFEPPAATGHNLALLVSGTCAGGSGISAVAGAVDVIGTR